MRDCYAHVRIHNAGLDGGALVLSINFQDAIHARKSYENAAFASERSTGKAGAGAAADDGRLITIRDLDDADDVFGVARENDAIRARDLDGSIVFVEQQLFGTMQNRVGSQKFF